MNAEMIIYEQPLNELIRICLRLEHLFNLVNYHTEKPNPENSRSALAALLDILSIIERPDLKTKIVKALAHHAERLTQLENSEGVDQQKLSACLSELDDLIDILHSQPGRIGQPLKENEFLATVRGRLSIPAGDCDFNLPSYQLWLAQSAALRIADLQGWVQTYTHLNAATEFLLKLTRQSAAPIELTIDEGFHQQSLDANISWQIIRIAMPMACKIYPEISVGRHRLSLRLHELNPQGRPTQTKIATKCLITLCSG